MHAKPVMLASLVCAAVLTAGCDRPQNDAMARKDATASNAPPVVAPAPPSSAQPSMTPPTANASTDTTAPGAKVADAISDTALTAKVKTALVAEPALKSTGIDVSTKDAVVTLSGTVESGVDKAKARLVAENVQGVKNVVDNMSLKS